jgi:cytochrome c oxidase subunit 2
MKWALLFGVTMLACAGLFIIAPFCGWWLPEGVSSHSWDVDLLFYMILGITSFFFVLTEGIMVFFMARYSGEPGEKAPKHEMLGLFKPVAGLLDSQHKIEMAWTIVPAAILLLIAFSQISAWANIKYQSRMAPIETAIPVQVDVSARQFEWRMRYPSSARFKEWLEKKVDARTIEDMKSFANYPQKSDVHVVNELHVWDDHQVLVHLTTRDVLHSFNLPQMRVKQDALPGKQIPVWFVPKKANLDDNNKQIPGMIWEIPCAELCGWGHGRMIGRLFVHKNQEGFFRWLSEAEKSQFSTSAAK